MDVRTRTVQLSNKIRRNFLMEIASQFVKVQFLEELAQGAKEKI
jgi:hypothetical protein